jgi:phosphoglycerate kinase
MAAFRTVDDLDVKGKRVLLRADLNVPVKDGEVTDTTRIERTIPTVNRLLEKGAAVLVLSHFERPKGKPVPGMSLRPLAAALQSLLGKPVHFVNTDWRDDAAAKQAGNARPGEVYLFENTRFHPGEEENDPAFARRLAALGDAYVNDAFSAAHRAHASTEGVAHLLPSAAGLSMQAELEALEAVLGSPERPVAAIVGGAKVSTKLELLSNLIRKVDILVIGGGMANTFLAAQGIEVGRSLQEAALAGTAREIAGAAGQAGCRLLLPTDAVVAKRLEPGASTREIPADQVGSDEMILDIGPDTVRVIEESLAGARTLVWNGPVGAFETEPFDRATVAIAKTVARLTREGRLRSVAGGGDTIAALNKAGVADELSYVSTAGGAFLEWLEGKQLPGVEALRAGGR